MSDSVLCKDCKHSFRKLSTITYWGSGFEWLCKKAYVAESVEQDPVTGPKKIEAHYKRCASVRLHDSTYKDECGKQGIWWEPKDRKNFFLYLKRI